MFLFQAHKVFANLNVLTLTEINHYYLNFFVVNEHFILKSTQQKMPPNFAFLILDSGLVIFRYFNLDYIDLQTDSLMLTARQLA